MNQRLEQAEGLRLDGHYEQARRLYEQILAEDPVSAPAWWGLAHTVMNEGEFELALAHFQRAIELEPDNQRTIYDLAMAHTMLGEFEEARPLFERVVAIDPDSRHGAQAQKQLSYY